MKKLFWFYVSLLTFLVATTVFAVPASPDAIEFEQPNGAVIQVFIRGDEYLNWNEDEEGNLLSFDESKNGYCYAVWTNDGSMSTGNLVGTSTKMSLKKHKGNAIPQKLRTEAKKAREDNTLDKIPTKPLTATRNMAVNSVVNNVSALKRKLVMINVRWEDESNIVPPPLTGEQIYNIVFNPNTDSVNKYYTELVGSSDSIITPANVTTPLDNYQGIIEIKLPGKHTDPNGDSTEQRRIISQSLIEAGKQINFADFDLDGNAILESTELSIGFIIHGFEASSTSTYTARFWGMAYTGGLPTVGGVSIETCFSQGAYHISSDNTHPLTIGVICHEMGHSAYGFKDTYDYGNDFGGFNDGTSEGHGYWSLMSIGNWGRKTSSELSGSSPAYVDAYNLVKYNIVSPGIISETTNNIQVKSHIDIYKVINEKDENQYFLLQQRKYGLDDNFDRGAFYRINASSNTTNGGLMIFHIDENVPLNRMNDKNTHYMAGIEEAHGRVQNLQQVKDTANYNTGTLDDLWGGDYKLFSRSSNPSSGLYSTFTYDTVPPSQEINSSTTIHSITWDSSTQLTEFTVNKTDAIFSINKFTIQDSLYDANINQASQTITVMMPSGTDVTSLVPTIEIEGASLSPASGLAQDFSKPVLYTVTGENGDYKTYVVTVSVFSAVSDGINFTDIYQTYGSNLSNTLQRYIYLGNYLDNGDYKPRLWHVVGKEDGAFVLMQQYAYENEKLIFNPQEANINWKNSAVYKYLNANSANGFTDFFKNSEIEAIQKTTVNSMDYNADTSTWTAADDSRDTLFYLMSLHNNGSNATWSATLDDYQNKYLGTSLIRVNDNTSDRYWLRSIWFMTGFYSQAYAAYGNSFNRYIPYNNIFFLRPLLKLNPNAIVLFSEIGTDIMQDSNYRNAQDGKKNYKLTVLGGNSGEDVGILSGVPEDTIYTISDTYNLSGLSASKTGQEYSINYKIVRQTENNREIVGHGASSDLTNINIDTSKLTNDYDYTVYVWLQRNNSVQSDEASMPQSFKLLKRLPDSLDISIDKRIIIEPISDENTEYFNPKFLLTATEPMTITLYAASYEANGKLFDIDVESIELNANTPSILQALIPHKNSALVYKFFIWDSNYQALVVL